jgi:hypothetical protein
MLPSPPLDTAVLLIIFNRPDTTKAVFDAIQKVQPKRLYVAADGPRPGNAKDAIKCLEARKVIEAVDWPCDVKTRFSDNNLNCGVGPSSAMSWFFEHETQGIILEDDCLPSISFFWFCQELLSRYRDDTRVMHIGGNNFLETSANSDKHSYYFSRSGHIWGWATWRRAWNAFDYNITLYENLKKEGYFDKFFMHWAEKQYRLRKFDKTISRRGSVDWWDYQWDFARYINSGLAIIPHKNLVTNLGFGESATHTRNPKSRDSQLEAQDIEFPLVHTPFILRDVEKEKRYFRKFILNAMYSKLGL